MTSQDDIVAANPNHFPGPRTLEFRDGWNTLLVEFLAELDRLPGGEDVEFFCIKEKFGTLRIQALGQPPQGISQHYRALEEKYERLSATVCEDCGEPGSLRPGSWMRTVCDAHAR
jgi:hypothetical protein